LLEDKDDYFSKEKEVFKIFYTNINSAIDKYNRIFADATHLDSLSRMKLLNQINKNNIKEINVIFLNTNLEECIKRNASREGRSAVPEEVIRSMYQKLAIPDISEPFNNIYIVNINGDIDKISYKRNILNEEI
jgi:predicted kinase